MKYSAFGLQTRFVVVDGYRACIIMVTDFQTAYKRIIMVQGKVFLQVTMFLVFFCPALQQGKQYSSFLIDDAKIYEVRK